MARNQHYAETHRAMHRYRVTNAASESINAKIPWVKYTARGFRNKRNSKIKREKPFSILACRPLRVR